MDDVQKLEDLVTHTQTIIERIREESKKDLDIQKDDMRTYLKGFTKDEIRKHLEQYQQLVKSFQQFFDVDDIASLFDRKADLELLRRV